MPIPGHDLVIVRKSNDRTSPDFRLMRADCSCGRRGCVYFGTTDAVEKSFSHHVEHIATVAVTALNAIEAAMSSTRSDGGPAAVQSALATFRAEEKW